MPISFTPPTLANTGQVGGNQTNARTVALDNGGYVVAWQGSVGGNSDCFFQRYDALGAQVGTVTQIANPSQQPMSLQDIAVAGDGTFTIMTLGRIGPSFSDERMFVTSYSQTTGAQSAPQLFLNLLPLGPGGTFNGQLVPNPAVAGSLTVMASVSDGFNSDVLKAVVTTAGAVTVSPFLAYNNYFGADLQEAVEGLGGQQVAIFSDGFIDTNGSLLNRAATRDLVSLSPGTIVVATGISDSPQVALSMLSGTFPGILGWTLTGGGVSTNAEGLSSTGANIFDVELLDLGAGRILMVWVADGGDTTFPGALQDGIYAQVYNMSTGGPEGTATLIANFGTGSNNSFLLSITLGADLMADGRVSLGISYNNGLSGNDVFNTILDARVAGVNLVSSTTLSENFVGSAFNDTFSGVSNGDTIIGGAGSDTVIFGTSIGRSVDLQVPGNFPANTFVLTGIENLTGNVGVDIFYGDAAANILSGGTGNDTLYGRDGNDSLLGGASDDLLSGGNGADLLDGSTGIDVLNGGSGDDQLFGGADGDRLVGGTGNDSLSGDAGDDVLNGGAGDDELLGGAGADTLLAEQGADSAYGGADNDIIYAHAGVAVIDGGTGTDQLRVSGPLALGTDGFHIDLTGMFDLLGLPASLTRFADEISGIENVTGGTGNDFITGDGQVNMLRGGAGNDTIVSGGGADILFGNAGADVFVFTGTTGGVDQLRDFQFSTDKIGLVEGAFGDINAVNIGTRLTVNATGTVGATGVAQLIFDNSGAGFGNLSFDADGNGAGAAVLIATLTPVTGTLVAMTSSDFLFI